MKLLSAIAAAFRAMRTVMTTAWTYCKETGKWMARTVASIGASGPVASEIVDPVPEADLIEYGTAEDLIQPDDGRADDLIRKSKAFLQGVENVFSCEHSPGDAYDRIQRVCQARVDGLEPWFFDHFKLAGLKQDWIDTLTPEMEQIVAKASREDLIAHIKGGKGLRGVIRCDRESLEGWQHALEMVAARAEMEQPALEGEPDWARGRLASC